MQKTDVRFLLKSYFSWRLALFFVAFLALYVIPTFGARFPYYDRVLEITHLPNWIWGFGNFDGVHYLRIAQDGYKAQFSQAFFPLFPVLVRIFSFVFPRIPNLDTNIYTDPAFFNSGFILSNMFFLASLFVLFKLLSLDFKRETVRWSILFLLIYPTSFYFGSIYTESLFLLLAVSSIYLIRKNKYFYSSLLIMLATATRLIGVFLVLVFLVEVFKGKKWKMLFYTPIMFLGLAGYMYYLKVVFNNAFYFLTSQSIFGASRLANGLVLFPQVFYRYLKIFMSTNVTSLSFFNAAIEFLFTLIPLIVLLIYIRKMRLSYWIFSICALLLPTLTGTFSSMPRYVLAFIFLLIPYLVRDGKRILRFAILPLVLLGLVLLGLFIRGYWVA